mmetsp:Transcript_9933/g.60663  ORF Transcript_9933/g.60663 Transcript_9933/m.60663 type:complete len:123 (+) Transcript_9933:597-965(+)
MTLRGMSGNPILKPYHFQPSFLFSGGVKESTARRHYGHFFLPKQQREGKSVPPAFGRQESLQKHKDTQALLITASSQAAQKYHSRIKIKPKAWQSIRCFLHCSSSISFVHLHSPPKHPPMNA